MLPSAGAIAQVAHESKAAPRNCSDTPLLFAAVTDRPSGGIDPARERSVGDASTVPNRPYEFFLADHSIPVTHEMDKNVEHLRFDVSNHAVMTQLPALKIEFVAAGDKDHPPTSPRKLTMERRWAGPSDTQYCPVLLGKSGKPKGFLQDSLAMQLYLKPISQTASQGMADTGWLNE